MDFIKDQANRIMLVGAIIIVVGVYLALNMNFLIPVGVGGGLFIIGLGLTRIEHNFDMTGRIALYIALIAGVFYLAYPYIMDFIK